PPRRAHPDPRGALGRRRDVDELHAAHAQDARELIGPDALGVDPHPEQVGAAALEGQRGAEVARLLHRDGVARVDQRARREIDRVLEAADDGDVVRRAGDAAAGEVARDLAPQGRPAEGCGGAARARRRARDANGRANAQRSSCSGSASDSTRPPRKSKGQEPPSSARRKTCGSLGRGVEWANSPFQANSRGAGAVARGAAGVSRVGGARNVPWPTCAITRPRVVRAAYAALTVFRPTPSAPAASRVAGSLLPPASRPVWIRSARCSVSWWTSATWPVR